MIQRYATRFYSAVTRIYSLIDPLIEIPALLSTARAASATEYPARFACAKMAYGSCPEKTLYE
jgi:hypothetical protein